MEADFFAGCRHDDLIKFTNNFSDDNIIACFEFGKIYHGKSTLAFGFPEPVTVKIWDTSSSAVLRNNELRLMREVILLRNERVKRQPAAPTMFGYVCDGNHLAVVYYLKALNTVSHQICQDDFNWLHRIKVGFWFARLLKFFHGHNPPFEPFVIHNIDAANILLDEDYIPQLFDYNLMTGGGIFPDDETEGQKTGRQDDVFSFGVLLLSLISKQIITKEDVLEPIRISQKFVSWLVGNERVGLSPIHASFEVDPYFYASDGLQVLDLVKECLLPVADKSPSMKEVFRRLWKLQVLRKHYDLVVVKSKKLSCYSRAICG